jgi:hypothetical protein
LAELTFSALCGSRLATATQVGTRVTVDAGPNRRSLAFFLDIVAAISDEGLGMDNVEQSGPFNAARTFLASNPLWRKLGSAVAGHDPSDPFNPERASLPETTFIILEAPAHPAILPRKWLEGEGLVPIRIAVGRAKSGAEPFSIA